MYVPDFLVAGDLRLRRLTHADVTELHAYLSDRRVYESTSSDGWSIADVESLVSASIPMGDETAFICLGIEHETELIGTVRAGSYDARNRRVELGYDLATAYWGHGYVTSAVRALLDELFAQGIFRVEATVMEGNVRSERVLERLGFRREGVLRGYKQVRGEPKDFTMFGLLSPDERK